MYLHLFHNCFWKLLFDFYLKIIFWRSQRSYWKIYSCNNLLIFRTGSFKFIMDESWMLNIFQGSLLKLNHTNGNTGFPGVLWNAFIKAFGKKRVWAQRAIFYKKRSQRVMNNDKISQRGLNNSYSDRNACNPVSCFFITRILYEGLHSPLSLIDLRINIVSKWHSLWW